MEKKMMIYVQIFLLIIGILIVAATFIFGSLMSSGEAGAPAIDDEMIKTITREHVEKEVEYELANVIDEKVENTEAELDKLTNEKIMALGNYSETVMEEINKNHMEVMFLYNMLTEKEDTLKDTIRDIEALKISVKQMAVANDFAKQVAVKKSAKIVEETKNEPEEAAEVIMTKEEPIKNADTQELNNNQRILELYNKGMSNIEIAKELGLGIGEVKLVIGLFNNAVG